MVGEEQEPTYMEIVEETKKGILSCVNRDRVLMEHLHIPQGSRQVTEFFSQVEDQAALYRVEEKPIMVTDLKRISLIAGFSDRTLAKKCPAEEYDLK